jgi:hypothetical protein
MLSFMCSEGFDDMAFLRPMFSSDSLTYLEIYRGPKLTYPELLFDGPCTQQTNVNIDFFAAFSICCVDQ